MPPAGIVESVLGPVAFLCFASLFSDCLSRSGFFGACTTLYRCRVHFHHRVSASFGVLGFAEQCQTVSGVAGELPPRRIKIGIGQWCCAERSSAWQIPAPNLRVGIFAYVTSIRLFVLGSLCSRQSLKQCGQCRGDKSQEK